MADEKPNQQTPPDPPKETPKREPPKAHVIGVPTGHYVTQPKP